MLESKAQKVNFGYKLISRDELCRNLCCQSADAPLIPQESQESGSRRTRSGQSPHDTLGVCLADKKLQCFHEFESIVCFVCRYCSKFCVAWFAVFILKHVLRKSQKQLSR